MTTVNTVAEHGGPTVLEEHSDSKTKVHGVRYSSRTKRTRDSVFRTVFRVSLISPVLSTRWDETLPTKPTSNATSSEQCGGLALLKVGLSCYKDMIGTHHNPNKDRLSQVCNLSKDPFYIYRNFDVILNATVLQV